MLAQRLKWDFVDTDDLVEQKAGKSISEFIRSEGEASFRKVEKAAVKTASERTQTVIATGGGVPLDPENMTELSKNGETIWLKAEPQTILKRAGNFSTRPLIDATRPLDSIRERLVQREPFYSKAKYMIETDQGNSAHVVEKIISLFPSLHP